MRRVLVAIAGLVGLLALLGGGLGLFLVTADLRVLAERVVAQQTGRTVSIGSLKIDWGMRTRVALADMKLGNAPWGSTPHMIELGSLSAEVELRSLFGGTPRYERLSLEKLSMVLERGPGHVGNWKMPAGSIADRLVPRKRTDVPTVIDFTLDDARFSYRDAEIGLDLKLETTRMALAAANEEAPIRLTWRGAYSGIAATLEVEGQSFAVLRQADLPYGTTARVATGDSRLSFQGTLTEPLDFEGVDGTAKMETPNLGAFLTILEAGFDLPIAARVEGRFERQGSQWRVTGIKGEAAKNPFTGALSLSEASRHEPDALDLALRFPRLDLAPLLAGAGPKQSFKEIPLDPGKPGKINATARIEAVDVAFAGLSGTDLQFQGRRDGTGIGIDRFSVKVFGGIATGSGGLQRSERGAKLALTGDIDRMKLEDIARRYAPEAAGIAGRLIGQFGVEAEGRTVGDALATLRGHSVSTLTEGRVPRALMEKVSSNLRFLFRDRTNFSEIICFLTLLEIREGVAHLAPLRMRTLETTVSGRGRIDLLRERVDVAITTDQRASSLFSLNIPLQVRGPFAQVGVGPLIGQLPPARVADLASLPPASRGIAERNACLR